MPTSSISARTSILNLGGISKAAGVAHLSDKNPTGLYLKSNQSNIKKKDNVKTTQQSTDYYTLQNSKRNLSTAAKPLQTSRNTVGITITSNLTSNNPNAALNSHSDLN